MRSRSSKRSTAKSAGTRSSNGDSSSRRSSASRSSRRAERQNLSHLRSPPRSKTSNLPTNKSEDQQLPRRLPRMDRVSGTARSPDHPADASGLWSALPLLFVGEIDVFRARRDRGAKILSFSSGVTSAALDLLDDEVCRFDDLVPASLPSTLVDRDLIQVAGLLFAVTRMKGTVATFETRLKTAAADEVGMPG